MLTKGSLRLYICERSIL